MKPWEIIVLILAVLIVLFLLASLIAYFKCFYNNLKGSDELIEELNTEQFKPFLPKMKELINEK